MTPEAFADTLRQFLRHVPFLPFIIELADGEEVVVDAPHTVSLGTQVAGFLSPDYKFHSIHCDQVREIRFAKHQAIS